MAKSNYSASFLAEIRKKLVDEQGRLVSELSRFAKPVKEEDFDTRFPDFGDKEDENAAEVAEYSANLTLEQTLESMMRDVKKSLERLDKGDYGICKYCKKPIDEKRLLARPTSSSCVECKKTIIQEV
jgi:DnaK suppressor protein